MNNSINKKLSVGFGLCLLLIITVVGFNYSALRKLNTLYHETLIRSGNMELTTDAQHIGEELYLIIANAVINRDLAQSDRAWVVCKKESLEKLSNVAKAVETPGELVNVREAEQAIQDIIQIYEREMLPLILRGATVPGPLSNVDAKLDKRIDAIDLALQRVAQSMLEKNRKSEREYKVVLKQMHGFGLMISLAGVLVVIGIIFLATRQIVGPLTEITGAALEIKKGNYLVGLKHTSSDEIGVLSDAFREMSLQVEKRTLELQDANEHLQNEICERGHAEQLLQEARNELEQRVVERTHELSATNTKLNQEIFERVRLEQQLFEAKKLESIGQLAGGVAHEVRNPLNAILSITEALFKEKEIESNPEFEPYINHIRTQVHRLANLMNDLLELGKPISAANLQIIPLSELCRETMELWKVSGLPEDRHVVLTAVESAAATLVTADSSKLQQAIFNLLENACNHSPAKNTIILHLAETVPDSGMAIVQIIDTGKGIQEKNLPRVFEPFYSDRKGGTGLGLSLVKHFIENMGGSVRIWNNNPPPGCTAELSIPLAVKEHT